MHRRTTVYALVAATLVLGIGCSGSSEKKLLADFFRAARLKDDVTLGNFAAASFNPRTDGIVESFDVTSVSPERSVPLPLKTYAKAVEDKRAEDADFTAKRREFQGANQAAINRIMALDGAGKPIPAKDQPLKGEWDKWVADTATHRKAMSDAMKQLSDARGIAELSLSRPNGATVDATKYDGEMVTKDVLLTANVKQPDGQSVTKNLKAVLQRAKIKDESGKDVAGRWIISSIGPA